MAAPLDYESPKPRRRDRRASWNLVFDAFVFVAALVGAYLFWFGLYSTRWAR